uniref:Uncharacterized protein n=1 Tax=Arundo donax TaxID=35708 RepID=A0A0A9A5X8_ARUDO
MELYSCDSQVFKSLMILHLFNTFFASNVLQQFIFLVTFLLHSSLSSIVLVTFLLHSSLSSIVCLFIFIVIGCTPFECVVQYCNGTNILSLLW